MKEQVLIDFLAGQAEAARLADDLADAYSQTSLDVWALNVEHADARFTVDRRGMLRVCDAAVAGDLDPRLLEPIGDCLMMSATFEFEASDRGLLANVAHCWSSPEICYPLDATHVKMFREWLATGREPD